MLGTMMVRQDELRIREFRRYRAFYCGICRSLGRRRGMMSRLALSFEMTFLAMLLTSLYDDAVQESMRRCALHPARKHPELSNPAIDYCADLSVMTAWYDLRDGWEDDRRVDKLAESAVLSKAAMRTGAALPRQRDALEAYAQELHEAERRREQNLDFAANLTGRMLGELYVMREDVYSADLRQLGYAVGKFLYLSDCYEDIEQDRRKGAYNPLLPLADREGFAKECEQMLSAVMEPGAEAFERLPLLDDAEILRNILYSGIWLRFERATQKREESTHI